MKVETKPVEQKPDVVITLSWEEAKKLRAMCGGTGGNGPGRSFTGSLQRELSFVGIKFHYGEVGEMSYLGKFDNE